MLVDETAQAGEVALAGLAQHPARGLVHQVVLVADKAQGERESVVEVAFLYEGEGRHDGYAVVPKQGAGGKFIQYVARLVIKIFADNLRRYVSEARTRGAVPVLLTPIVRRHFSEREVLDEYFAAKAAGRTASAAPLKAPPSQTSMAQNRISARIHP